MKSPLDLVEAVRRRGIDDWRLLDAFRTVRRADFVPTTWRGRAYFDEPIPIAHGQVTTQPMLIAEMLAELRLKGSERALEIGTGLGFQTALLARLCAKVVSIERFRDLAEQARANLLSAGIANAMVVVGDGTLGYPEGAPYDAIVVAAAAPVIPKPLELQLAEGGRLVHPLGPGGDELVVSFRKQQGELVRQAALTRARFVPLVGAHDGRR